MARWASDFFFSGEAYKFVEFMIARKKLKLAARKHFRTQLTFSGTLGKVFKLWQHLVVREG